MYEIVGLTFPFFALIFLGYLCGKIFKLPQAGLAWLTVYIVYVALPALFYDLIAKTPFEKLLSFGFVFTALFATRRTWAVGPQPAQGKVRRIAVAPVDVQQARAPVDGDVARASGRIECHDV